MSAALDTLMSDWSRLQSDCKATGHAAECADLLRPAVERVRALVREAPCPDGWSRLDYVFGRSDTCDVPVLARDACALLGTVTSGMAAMCFAYQMWRLRAHGAAKSSKYLRHSVSMSACAMMSLHNGTAVLTPSYNSALTITFMIVALNYIFRMGWHGASVTLNNLADTIFSLHPARAAAWHARLAVVGDFTWPLFDFGVTFGFLQTASSHATRDSALAQRGTTFGFATMVAYSGLGVTLLAFGALGTSRAERALSQSTGTHLLRSKLQQQRKFAWVSSFVFGGSFLGFGCLAAFSGARPFCGTVFQMMSCVSATAVLTQLLPAVLRSVRRQHKRRSRRASVHAAAVAPLRFITNFERTTPPIQCPVPVARRGVSLSFLRAVAADPSVGAHTTTAEVCRAFVKPKTAFTTCALYDLLWADDAKRAEGNKEREGGERYTGESDFFLSHTWSYRFQDLVATIEVFERRLAPQETQYYWFDIFVMNQHSEHDLSQRLLLENLHAAVSAPGRVLLALDSWREPTPLARVWCLLEIWTAMNVGAEVVMCLSEAEQASFALNLARNQAEVHRALDAVDAEQAKATVEADRDVILGLIRGGTGFEHFNRTIRDELRQSFELVAVAAAQRRL